MQNCAGGSRCSAFGVFAAMRRASEAILMPWRFDTSAIDPERIRAMQGAYYKACDKLGLAPISDAITEILVTKIIDLCNAGERDPDHLSEAAVAFFRAAATSADPERA
jgi:hypothetical protein